MFPRRLWTILGLFFLAVPLRAQDAHSMAIGGAAAAAPMGIFGIYWNPSILGAPNGSPTGWAIASGFSAFDTSNSGQPIVHFQPSDGLQSTQDPIHRYQQYLGLFAVQYFGTAGGVVYDQELNYLASQSALQFFNDRNNGPIAPGSTYNNLNFQQTNQQVANLVLSYGMPLPIGNLQMLTVGGSLKYHDGLWYQQTSLTGTYTKGTPSNYTYTKTTSNTGLGLSIDGGLLAKFTDALTVGLMLENLTSNFTWQATQQNYQLDPNTGAESPSGSAQSVTIAAPFPYATKLGMVFTPPANNVGVEGQVSWSQHQTRWSAGLEHFYPESHLIVRLGTFADEISNQQMWSFGIGYLTKVVAVDASFLTRSIPNLQDSISLGGALDVVVIF